MQQTQLLEKIIKLLEDNNIQYLITGSYASSLQGTPRSTHDINIVVVLNKSAINLLKNAFPFLNIIFLKKQCWML